MWDVSHIENQELEYMGYDIDLEIYIETNYEDDRVRVVRANAMKESQPQNNQPIAMPGATDHMIEVSSTTKIDGEEKLWGLVEVEPTPLDEQLDTVISETKENIERSIDERIEARQEVKDHLEEVLESDDDLDIELPDGGDDDGSGD